MAKFTVLPWQLNKWCKKCSNFIRVIETRSWYDDDYGKIEVVDIEVKSDCRELCPYIHKVTGVSGSEIMNNLSKKPQNDCVHWGENIFPFFDDGCHLGHSWCDPENCEDYEPIDK